MDIFRLMHECKIMFNVKMVACSDERTDNYYLNL